MPKCGCSGTTCGCSIVAGSGTSVTGTGTAKNPFKIAVNPFSLGLGDAIKPSNTGTVELTKSGAGGAGDPLVLTGQVALRSPNQSRWTPSIANDGSVSWTNGTITSGAGSAYNDELAQDAAAALFAAGSHTGISFTYDDAGNRISATVTGGGSGGTSYTDEQAQDAAASLFTSGGHTGITFSYDDAGNRVVASVTANGSSYTDEQAQDAVAALLAAGSHTGITFSYDDAGNRLSATVTGGGSGGGGAAPSGLNPNTGFYHADGNGILPANSGTANTSNLQGLLDSIPTSFGGAKIGGTVVFPVGKYTFAGNVRVPKGVRLLGMSGSRVGTEGASDAVGVAFIMGTSGMTLLTLNTAGNGSDLVQVGPSVEGINFYGQNIGFSGTAIYAPNVNRWTIRDCGFKWCGIGVDGDSRANVYQGGDCSWWAIENSTFVECGIGLRCLAASGELRGGDMTDCGIGIDLYGVSAPMKVTNVKMDIGANQTGIRCRAYNCLFMGNYFELTTNTSVGMTVGPDPAVNYSGNDNVIVATGFYGRANAPQATGLKILSGANRTKVVAPILGLNDGYKIQDGGSQTVVLAA